MSEGQQQAMEAISELAVRALIESRLPQDTFPEGETIAANLAKVVARAQAPAPTFERPPSDAPEDTDAGSAPVTRAAAGASASASASAEGYAAPGSDPTSEPEDISAPDIGISADDGSQADRVGSVGAAAPAAEPSAPSGPAEVGAAPSGRARRLT